MSSLTHKRSKYLKVYMAYIRIDIDLFYKGRAERTGHRVLKEKFLFVSKHVSTSVLWDEGYRTKCCKI